MRRGPGPFGRFRFRGQGSSRKVTNSARKASTFASKVSCTSLLTVDTFAQDIKYFISVSRADIKWLTIIQRTGDGTKTDPPQEGHLLDGEKILVTGVTGKIAFPIARRWPHATKFGARHGCAIHRTATTSSPPG